MSPTYWLFGTHLTILADEQQTNSHYDLIEGRFPAGTQTPLHLHAQYDEAIYVLEGAFTLYTDTQMVTLKPGDQLFIPKNAPHVVVASSHTINRALTVASPVGLANSSEPWASRAPAIAFLRIRPMTWDYSFSFRKKPVMLFWEHPALCQC